MKKHDRNTPIRRGRFYCSRACGGKCTHADYLAAKRRATSLVDGLGAQWNVRVWDNLGWHSAAEMDFPSGNVAIYPYARGDFGLILNAGKVSFSLTGTSAGQLVKLARRELRASMVAIGRVADALEAALAGAIDKQPKRKRA